MTAIIIDRKKLKADTRQLLRGAPVSPKAMVALYLGIALVLDLLVSFVLFTLIACWAVWTIWKVKENRFNELLAMTNNQEIPRDYSVPSPRGVKEKFPDFDWERKGK